MEFLNILAANTANTKIDPGNGIIHSGTVNSVVLNILNLVYFSAGIVAVIVIILAGYMYTTAVYDPAKISQAKNAILYAAIGLVVVIMAFAITQFIMGRF